MKPMNLWGGPLIDYLLFESFLTASDFGVLQPVSGLEKHRRKLAGRPVVSALPDFGCSDTDEHASDSCIRRFVDLGNNSEREEEVVF
jgi:hypothetical protein